MPRNGGNRGGESRRRGDPPKGLEVKPLHLSFSGNPSSFRAHEISTFKLHSAQRGSRAARVTAVVRRFAADPSRLGKTHGFFGDGRQVRRSVWHWENGVARAQR